MTANRLTPRARSLRQSSGLPEDHIWDRLRGGKIDGGIHARDDVVTRDHWRQVAIESLGWTVVRFTNAEALTEPWRIDEAIRAKAKDVGRTLSHWERD